MIFYGQFTLHKIFSFTDEEIIEGTNVAAPLISMTTTAPTTTAATAPVPVVANFSQSLPSLVPSVAQPIAGPSFPCGAFYSAHPATHAAISTPPQAQPGVPACPAKGKSGTQAAKGGGCRSGRGCSTAAAVVIMTQILAIHFLLFLPLSFLQPGQLVCTLRVLTSETQW